MSTSSMLVICAVYHKISFEIMIPKILWYEQDCNGRLSKIFDLFQGELRAMIFGRVFSFKTEELNCHPFPGCTKKNRARQLLFSGLRVTGPTEY